MTLSQTPDPGSHQALCCGDRIEFRLHRPQAGGGTAWLRTNLGGAVRARADIVAAVEQRRARLARDWHDLPMMPAGPDEFVISVPAGAVGHFEAKTYFMARFDAVPEWPAGDNVALSVAPATAVCANGIYNAFVRQFGARRPTRRVRQRDYSGVVDASQTHLMAPSGTFRDLIARLDLIIGELGCRYLLLLPVHPVPAVYGRMGLYGSPYAATDFYAIEPALARFDRHATPLDQFDELVDAVHARQAGLLMDVAINHCGWAAALHAQHPEWIVRDPDGAMRSPGAWGVTWHDLTELDYSQRQLWRYMADVLLFWCRRGVDGFRCDAGYMVPCEAWEYIVAKVRDQYPDTLFLLEGLGGKISVTRRLLQTANLNWAYSELFQQYTREQVEAYLPLAQEISGSDGVLVNFAETHDNNRLAAQSHAEARLRTAMAALLSQRGAFAFANGVEWLATEKIDVHGNSDLNWGAPVNLVSHIKRLNRLLRLHPAFQEPVPLRSVQADGGAALALLRGDPSDARRLLILANLDTHRPAVAAWHAGAAGIGCGDRIDLLRNRLHSIEERDGSIRCSLAPGAVLCLPGDPEDASRWLSAETGPVTRGFAEPRRILIQRARAKVMALQGAGNGDPDDDLDEGAGRLLDDPIQFLERDKLAAENTTVCWVWPRDVRRCVMVPPGHRLYLRAPVPFRAELRSRSRTVAAERSMPAGDGAHFVLFTSGPPGQSLRLLLRLYHSEGVERNEADIRFLPPIERIRLPGIVARTRLPAADGIVLRSNRRGGMLRAGTDWGRIASRYDALLAANLDPEHPVDRRVLLTRYRAWIEYRGYSHALNRDCLRTLDLSDPRSVQWRFRGAFAPPAEWTVELRLEMAAEANAVRLEARVMPADGTVSAIPLPGSIDLILRPDIEDRSFHDDTLAFAGPEREWPGAVQPLPRGFRFVPRPGGGLRVEADAGTFVAEPEWTYQVAHPVEAERGMRGAADLFSPGYLRVPLSLTRAVRVDAVAGQDDPGSGAGRDRWFNVRAERAADAKIAPHDGADGLETVLGQALQAFIVRRGPHKTVIAGYPWFLDWGRDTLIVARGLVAAGMFEEVAAILRQFASFENGGTLPNMIRGDDARDRDTSDAPLWFVVACADLVRATGDRRFLETSLDDGRTIAQVVRDIVDGYERGTVNGIRVDPESGLVFSPPHFTWMDTNYPAATPREGYPIEIQALWQAAVRFLSEISGDPRRRDRADQARASIMDLFFLGERGYFSDCLHARPGQPARQAQPDDALRPNQLFLLMLDGVPDGHRIGRRVLKACGELVVPGALRSLADRPVEYPLPVSFNGRSLNDPLNPYWGRYEGDEDTRRKPAYHNGTAWVWLYPGYVEAWWKTYGPRSRPTALALLGAAAALLREGCLLQLPELLEGDAPHRQRGCDAQAWSVSEAYRVLRLVRGRDDPAVHFEPGAGPT